MEAVTSKPGRMNGALAALSLSMLLSSLGTSSPNVALPTLARSFAAPVQQVQWVVIAYLLAITALIVSVGRLGDITGRRRLLLAGIVVFTVASVLCGAAPSLWLLIAARAGQGVGAAIMMALTMAFIGDTVPKEKTGGAMGLLGTMSAVGTALGPSLGGLAIEALGWRAIFFINLPLGLVTLALAWRYLPQYRIVQPARPSAFDHLGTLLLALTLGTYALAMTLGRGSFGVINLALLAAAAAGLMLFVAAQKRAPAPLIRLTMLRDPGLGASLIMSALVTTVMMATLVVGPFYLSRAFGLDAAMVGLVMSAGPVAAALAGVPAGRLADRFGARHMTIAGLAGLSAGSCALALLPAAFGVPAYLGAIVVMTVSFAVFQTANNTAVMADIAPDRRGVVSGLLNLSRNLGFVTGASVMASLYAFAGMRITFLVAAALPLAGLGIALAGKAGSDHGTNKYRAY